MKRILRYHGDYRSFIILSLLLFSLNSFSASYVTIDGIRYKIENNIATVYTVDDTITVANILDRVQETNVTGIGNNAFKNCSFLTLVKIPCSVIWIGSSAFWNCSSLTQITIPTSVTSIGDFAFYNCKSLTQIEIPASVTSIGWETFNSCTSLTQIEIPFSITSIGTSAFEGCSSLTKINVDSKNTKYSSMDGVLFDKKLTKVITVPNGKKGIFVIPKSVVSIDDGIFQNCSYLTQINVDIENNKYSSIDGVLFDKKQTTIIAVPARKENIGIHVIPSSVTSISNYAFDGCTSLTELEIPNSVTSIGDYAFAGCQNLRIIVIPPVQNIGKSILSARHQSILRYIFSYVNVENNKDKNPFEGISSLTTIFCPSNYVSIYKKLFSGTVNDINSSFSYTSATQGKVLFKIPNKYDDISTKQLYKLTDNNDTIYSQKNGELYELNNLEPGKSYIIGVDSRINCGLGNYWDLTLHSSVVTKNIGLSCTQSTQTKLTLDIEVMDVTVSDRKLQYRIKGESKWKSITDINSDKVEISGLIPGVTYECYASVYINGKWYSSMMGNNYQTFTTKSINPVISNPTVGQTTFRCSAIFQKGDATIEEYGFTGFGVAEKYNNTTELKVTGLDPNTKYKVIFKVKTKEGGVISSEYVFTTKNISITTQSADACSHTTATIRADMNCDAEDGTGFEWRKMDAPNLVPSNFVKALIIDGKMVFSLRSLTPSTYYKYRPYYKSESGKYYYGEWIGFGTSDAFVLHVPIVETFSIIAIQENVVTLSGYIIAGSEDILQQGFDYWKEDNNYLQTSEGYKTVITDGPKMTVTLKNLEYNSSYRYRAFAKTASGTTYGEEMKFKTLGITGMENVCTTKTFNVILRNNPTYGEVYIRIDGDNDYATYHLSNLNGYRIASGQIITDNSWQTIDIKHCISGIYILNISTKKHSKTLKLVVE